jgi:hypothetical protein
MTKFALLNTCNKNDRLRNNRWLIEDQSVVAYLMRAAKVVDVMQAVDLSALLDAVDAVEVIDLVDVAYKSQVRHLASSPANHLAILQSSTGGRSDNEAVEATIQLTSRLIKLSALTWKRVYFLSRRLYQTSRFVKCDRVNTISQVRRQLYIIYHPTQSAFAAFPSTPLVQYTFCPTSIRAIFSPLPDHD